MAEYTNNEGLVNSAEKDTENKTEEKKSFIKGFNLYKIFWIFFIGSIIGVIVEMIYCLFVEHKIESRQGLIYGPFNPVYGGGAVFITLVAENVKAKGKVYVFAAGAFVGGVFEIFCCLWQEVFFGVRSWDYTGEIGALAGGRTSLFYCVFWGALTLLWTLFLYPPIERWLEKLPSVAGPFITWCLIVFMLLNSAISSIALFRAGQRNSGIPPANPISAFVDEVYDDEFMSVIYPNYDYSFGRHDPERKK